MIYFSAALFFIGLVLIVWAFFKDSVRRIRRRNRDNEPIAFISLLVDSEYKRWLGEQAKNHSDDGVEGLLIKRRPDRSIIIDKSANWIDSDAAGACLAAAMELGRHNGKEKVNLLK